MSMVSPARRASSSMGQIDEFLNLDMTTNTSPGGGSNNDYYSDLFQSPLLSDITSPSSATAFLPPTTPPLQPIQAQGVLDTIDITNHTVFNDLYKTYIEPLQAKHDFVAGSSAAPTAVEPGAFSFNDLFASYAATANPPAVPTTAANTTIPMASLFSQALATNDISAGGAAARMGFPPFTIDPQLVATPAVANINASAAPTTAITATTQKPSAAAPRASTVSVIDEDDEDDEEDDEEDEDEEMMGNPPTSAAAKAKAARAKKLGGGVAAGGIVKRTGATSCVVRDADSNDPDDWRPSPEEYKKLSSKEKRQLRNKISARNFRVRRKEYITTLEGQISDRDKLISAIREELGAQQLQNSELRQEIDALKKAMLDGRHPHPVGLPPPTPLAALSQTQAPATKANQKQLAKANPNKDIGKSGSPRGFWGGHSMGMGGVTPVHSAFSIVPDRGVSLASVLSGKGAGMAAAPTNGPGAKWLAALQENINPHMNPTPNAEASEPSSSSEANSSSSSSRASSSSPQTPPLQLLPSLPGSPSAQLQQAWNGYADINPFTIKTLDSYRLQLWAKMAADSAQAQQLQQAQLQLQQAQQQQAQQQNQNLFNTFYASSLSGSLKPQFFSESKDGSSSSNKEHNKENVVPKGAPSLSAVLAGKTASALSKPNGAVAGPSTSSAHTHAQTALAATAISQTFVSRMGSAFWDAFSCPSTAASSSAAASRPSSVERNWDMEKVRRVLEGKAVLKVVDVEGPDPAAGLEERMSAMSLSAARCGAAMGRKESWVAGDERRKIASGEC